VSAPRFCEASLTDLEPQHAPLDEPDEGLVAERPQGQGDGRPFQRPLGARRALGVAQDELILQACGQEGVAGVGDRREARR
jgi:hypothetical protein